MLLDEFDKLNIADAIVTDYGHHWHPSATQRREFAERMKDPEEQRAYNERKEAKAEKRRSQSRFDYSTAGGQYVPTQAQADFADEHRNLFKTAEEQRAAAEVSMGFTDQHKVNHDYIHIVNEKIRSYNSNVSDSDKIERFKDITIYAQRRQQNDFNPVECFKRENNIWYMRHEGENHRWKYWLKWGNFDSVVKSNDYYKHLFEDNYDVFSVKEMFSTEGEMNSGDLTKQEVFNLIDEKVGE